MTNYLNNINNPKDLKELEISQLDDLAEEIRAHLIERLDVTGGHFGSNLGTVELEIAMHYVFDSPKDKFVFDVSHQSYTHKILTGRKEFITPGEYLKYSGYTNQDESEHDFFKVGHTATSISLATGLAKARDLKKEKGNVVAVIGDGSMSGGEAFEGLNNAAILDSNMIIIFNDNQMSIAVNQGGMYKNFAQLRESNGTCPNNFFKAMGMDYIYVNEGNNIAKLVEALQSVKDIDHPIVVHINTLKGKGSKWAYDHQEDCHWTMPKGFNPPKVETYSSLTAAILMDKIKKDPTVIAINAATPGAVGLSQEWRQEAGKQFIDVGIAEEHAVAFSSGIAKGGAKPVYLVLGSFLQRTYDQLMQDLALNKNSAVILVYGASIGAGDATHNNTYISSMENIIPNVKVFSPSYKEDYIDILNWAIEQNEMPVIINVPAQINDHEAVFDTNNINHYNIEHRGSKVALIGFGNFLSMAKETAEELKKYDIDATIIDPIISNEIDSDTLNDLKNDHQLVVTLEDGMLNGGFGENVSRFYNGSSMKLLNFGAQKEYLDRIGKEAMKERYHLKAIDIADRIKEVL